MSIKIKTQNYLMKYNQKMLLIFTILFICTFQISIPLTQSYDRCMIVYTSTPDENLILDIKFPQIPNKQNGEFYRVNILNTEDKSQMTERVNPGIYRKQLDLQQNVVYKVCFALVTYRSVGTLLVEYNAQTKFHTNLPNVKVPESLLKSEDFKNTYGFAENMHSVTELSIQYQNDRKARQDSIYAQNKSNIDMLFWISLFQIAIILTTGVYQFFNVRNFLISKQYI